MYNEAYAVAKNFRPHIVTQGELVEMLAPSTLTQSVSAVTQLLRNTLPNWERAGRTDASTRIKRGLEDLFFSGLAPPGKSLTAHLNVCY